MLGSDHDAEAGKRRCRKPVSDLTEHQLRTLRVIQWYVEEHSIPPAVGELSTALGLTRSTIQDQIDQLVRKGYLNRESGKARSMSIQRELGGLPGELLSVPIVG